jgi:two-component system, NarL family, sensor kinase
MRLVCILFLLLFNVSTLVCYAQNLTAIRTEVNQAPNDSVKITLLLKHAWELKSSQPSVSHQFIDEAITHAQEIDSKKQLASAYYYKSAVYYLTTRYDSALTVSQKAIDIYTILNDHYGIASIYNLRGLLQEKIGDYSEAIHNYQQSLEFAAKTNNLYGQSNPLHNIGLIYDKTEDYKASLEYLQKALVIRQKIGDSILIAQSFQTIGTIQAHLGDTTQSIAYQQRAITFFKATNNLYDLALSYTNLGDLYTGLKKYDSAEWLLKESVRLNTEIDNAEGKVKALINLSSVALQQQQFAQAQALAREAIALSREYNLKPELKLALINLNESLAETGNFKAAFEAQTELINLSNTLLNDEKVQQLAQLETRYQVKQKEQQITLQQTTLQRTYLIIGGLIIIVGLLTVIFLLARSRFRRKEQIAATEKELAVQKTFIDATIQSQENERKRFAQDLHDGMGQLISSLRLMVHQLDRSVTSDETQAIANRSEEILNNMHTEIRGIAFNLMPQTLIQHGLLPALHEMALRLNQTGSLTVTAQAYDVPDRFSEVYEISVYRIIQEWINNVLKYANATKIDTQLVGHEQEITLTIEDNGNGFDVSTLKNGSGNGWKNINSRVTLIKGELEVDSRAGRSGTTFMLRFPTTYAQSL